MPLVTNILALSWLNGSKNAVFIFTLCFLFTLIDHVWLQLQSFQEGNETRAVRGQEVPQKEASWTSERQACSITAEIPAQASRQASRVKALFGVQWFLKSWSHLDFPPLFIPLPSGSPVKSPRKSPLKRSLVPGSFYGKKTAVYLTPLERKAIKEAVPPPPPLPPPVPSPPTQKMMGKKEKKQVKGRKKPGKVAAESKKPGKKWAVQPFSTVAKTIRLSKMNNRFVFESSRSQIGCRCWLFGIEDFSRFGPLFFFLN